MATLNLPQLQQSVNNIQTKAFFDKFFKQQVSFPSYEIDAVVGFFLKRGFDQDSSRSITIVLLNQARIDNVAPFSLLDSLKSLTDIQLSQIVAQVLNAYRENTSLLGYRVAKIEDTFESRNILV
jgi:hypothetical protein